MSVEFGLEICRASPLLVFLQELTKGSLLGFREARQTLKFITSPTSYVSIARTYKCDWINSLEDVGLEVTIFFETLCGYAAIDGGF